MIRIATTLLILFAAAGCATRAWAPLASHTIAVGPDQSRDVVWLENSQGTIVRCTDTAEGPVCVRTARR